MNDASAEWARIEASLDSLLALPAEDRAAAVSRIAGRDQDLRHQLESLLAQVGGEDPLLDRPALPTFDFLLPVPESIAAGTRIGAYCVVALLGRGGMGEVYRAERADGQYQQQVALKLIRRELADQPTRLQTERQTLARLDHPGIARLLDGGVADDGRPYMVMEFVAGQNIVAWCRGHACSLDQRLELFLAVCTAVEYAHRNLVVHRDLKPGNVLVTEDGTVKLLDFGIAKLLGTENDLAQTQNAPLTPGYAAPEQLLHGAVTTATDVYALGMLLFELLTGDRPWPLEHMSFLAGIDRVLRDAPPMPSQSALKMPQPPVLPRLLRGDLDAIFAKAVRKEPERRYETAAALRADIERHRQHAPVLAREGARLYSVGRFLRRYRLAVASAAVVVVAILVGTTGVIWQSHVARQQALRAEVESRKANAVKDFLLDIFKQSSLESPGGVEARKATAEQLLDVGAERINVQLREDPEVRDEVLATLAVLYNDLGMSDRAAALAQENLNDVHRRIGDAPSLDMVRAKMTYAATLIDSDKDDEAGVQLKGALAMLDEMGQRDTIDRAFGYYQQARAAYDSTAAEKPAAINNLITALDIVRRRDPGNALQGDILDYLGRFGKLDENYADAERWLRDLLAFEQSQGMERNAFPIGNAYLVLGDLQALMRHFDDAEINLRKSIDLLQAAAGPDHPTTAIARSRLGEMFFVMGRRAEGGSLLNEALAAEQKTPLGLESSTETRKTLGALELARGRLGVAEEVMRKNLEQLKTSPDLELRYGVSAAVMASILTAEGQLVEARQQYTRSLDIYRRFIGEHSIAYARTLVRGGNLLLAEGKAAQAGELFRQILQEWPPAEGQFPDEYTRSVLGLARAELVQGEVSAAHGHAGELLQRIEQSPERTHLMDQESQALRLVGEALLREGKAAEAERSLRHALQLRQQLDDDPASPWLAETRISLARCLVSLGKGDEARKLLTQARAAEDAQPKLDPQFRAPLRQANRELATLGS